MKSITVWLIKLKNWLRGMLVWMVQEPKDAWITVLVLVLIMTASFLVFGIGERWLRVAGFLLELLGIGVVAWGLNKSRQLFGYPGMYQVTIKWLKRYPKPWGQTHMLIVGCAHVVNRNDTMLATGGPVRITPATIEERVALLEERLNLADTQIKEERHKLEEETKNRLTALDSEAKARVQGDEVVQELLKEAVVGGILLETKGVVWLAFGVTLSSLSVELDCLISKLAGA